MIATVAVLSGAIAPAAFGAGPPVDGVDVSARGVASLDGTTRFVTLASPGGTTVARITQRGGQVERSRYLRGRFTIPPVAYDGSASGLSADRKRLVLSAIAPKYPRTQSGFAVLDARRLRVERIERLRGDFTFDAISPHGRWMYLTRYTTPGNPTAYEVRAYDLHTHRLMPKAIVDPREPDEKMQGSPITRATSADGRWAYTLYAKFDGGAPFIHALDTARRTARCIDLDLMGSISFGAGPVALAIDPDGQHLTVEMGTIPKAIVDLTTFSVSSPAAVTPPRTTSAESDDATNLWPFLGGGALAALLAAGGIRRMRRERPHQAA